MAGDRSSVIAGTVSKQLNGQNWHSTLYACHTLCRSGIRGNLQKDKDASPWKSTVTSAVVLVLVGRLRSTFERPFTFV